MPHRPAEVLQRRSRRSVRVAAAHLALSRAEHLTLGRQIGLDGGTDLDVHGARDTARASHSVVLFATDDGPGRIPSSVDRPAFGAWPVSPGEQAATRKHAE